MISLFPHFSPNIGSESHWHSNQIWINICTHKSKALNISIPPDLQTWLQESLPFTWLTTQLTYLGIIFTENPANLYKANYPPLLTRLTSLMKIWSSLPFTWMGRITVIKMSILPKILYLFRVLPIQVPAYFLWILQQKASQFIWGKLKPHLRHPTMYTPRWAQCSQLL